MSLRIAATILPLAFSVFSSCISHTHPLPPSEVLLKADTITKAALLDKLRANSRAISTLMVSKSSLKASRMKSDEAITDYRNVDGKIAVDRPGHIRLEIDKVITLAQMVSDEKQYRVSVPPKGKFGVGDVAAPVQGADFPYNLRPSHILDALFVDGEQYVGKSGIDSYVTEATEPQPDGMHSYSIILFGKVGGEPIEQLWFDRTTGVMEVVRKISFLKDGKVEADIRYSDFGVFGTISFPKKIVIKRPIENYALEMNIEKLDLNKPIDASTFKLERPDGVDDVDLNTGKDIKKPQ